MRQNLVCGLGLPALAFLGILSMGSYVLAQTAGTAPAQPVPNHHSLLGIPAGGKTTVPPTGVASGHGTGHGHMREALRTAHRLLAEADHDYSGHRAKAAQHVHLAMEDLGHHHHATGVAAGSTTGAGPATGAAKGIAKGAVPGVAAPGKVAGAGTAAHHESQANSDRQLREAGMILQKVLGHMNATKHPRARANIQMALSEIGTALSVK